MEMFLLQTRGINTYVSHLPLYAAIYTTTHKRKVVVEDKEQSWLGPFRAQAARRLATSEFPAEKKAKAKRGTTMWTVV